MQRFQNILLYVGAAQDEGVASRAVELAIENNARLTFLDVVRPIPRALGLLSESVDPDEMERLVIADHRHRLLETISEYCDTSIPLDAVVRAGSPAVEIVRQVIRGHHDLVIKTADGQSGLGRLLGSVTRSLMRTCPCPVWAIKPDIGGRFGVVLAAIDLQDNDVTHRDLNKDILKFASSIAIRDEAQLNVVSAWDVWMDSSLRRRVSHDDVDQIARSREQQVREELDQLLQWLEITLPPQQIHLSYGPAAYVIRMAAKKTLAELLVMGTLCRTGISGLLIGNTAEQLLGETDCSVLALKPRDFQTPIELEEETSDQDLPMV